MGNDVLEVVVVVLRPEGSLREAAVTSKSILAHTMQWMGFSGRMRMVQTGKTFWLEDLGSQE